MENQDGVDKDKLHHVVLDSGGIIKGETQSFHRLGAKFWTVAEVLSEIRDMKARQQLEMLPVELEVRSPSDNAMRAVSGFARQTGDFAALSLVDLKVMALSYDLEVQMNGMTHIRTAPKRVNHSLPSKSSPASSAHTPTTISDEDMKKCTPCGCSDHIANEEHKVPSEVSEQTESPAHIGISETSDEETKHIEQDSVAEKDDSSCCSASEIENSIDCSEVEGTKMSDSPHFSQDDFPALDEKQMHKNNSSESTDNRDKISWVDKVSKLSLSEENILPPPAPKSNVILPANLKKEVQPPLVEASIESGQRNSNTMSVTSRILSGGTGSGYANPTWNDRQREEDDGLGWINPENVSSCRTSGQGMLNSQALSGFDDFTVINNKNKKRSKKNKNKPPQHVLSRKVNVACMTTDFAMQNVMVQMGLQVISTDCRIIKQIKQWILRCGACFHIHFDMDRLFCTRCGSNLMQRISASTDSTTGELKLHLRKNYQPNTRGMVHSLPKAGKQKKYDGELLLREDQLMTGIWRQKVVKVRKDIRSAFGEDVTADVGIHINKGEAIKVGLGRRNPNADKGRERRGKKKKK